MPLKVDMRVPACAPADQVADYAAELERIGFAGVGLPDSQLLSRDVYVAMALVAQRTSHLDLHVAVTNPLTRHASVTASAAQTVAELAPGRVTLIVGAGYSSVRTLGWAAATRAQMRQYVQATKRVLSGGPAGDDGSGARLHFASESPVKVYMAASGPRMAELAGEVADGVLLMVGLHPAIMAAAQERVDAGARRAGRDPAEIDIIHAVRTYVTDSMEAAYQHARPISVQWYIEPNRGGWLEAAGVRTNALPIPDAVWRLYPDIPHAENWAEAQRACAFMPQEMVVQVAEAIGLFGTPEHVARRLQDAARHGVRRLYVMTTDTYRFPDSTVRAFRDVVLPALARS